MYKQVWKWKVLPDGRKIKEYAQVRKRKLEKFFPNETRRRYDHNGARWRNYEKDERERAVESESMGSQLSISLPPKSGGSGVEEATGEDAAAQGSTAAREPYYNVHNTLVRP